MKISIKISDNNLSVSTKEEMWSVYKNYYHYTRTEFMERFVKNNYYALYSHAGKIIGFTGLRVNRAKVDGKRNLLIYFGQTVVEKQFRGNSLLPITGLKMCLKFFKDILSSKVYFWCDALTYKSYLVCAKSLSRCYPSRQHQTPKSVKNLIAYIGQQYYQGSFCAATGTVQKSVQLVSDPSVNIGIKDQKDEDIRFFMSTNPNYKLGYGLITIVPLNVPSFIRTAKRLVRNLYLHLHQSAEQILQGLLVPGL